MQIAILQARLLNTNNYVLWDTKTSSAILIDCTPQSKVSQFLTQNNLILKAILLTHGHCDHCGGVKTLLTNHPAPVYGHAADFMPEIRNKRYFTNSKDCLVTNPFDRDTTLEFDGIKIQIICTPGHSEGSVCYIAGNYLFSGDTLFKGDVGRTDLDGSDEQKMENSLRKLMSLTTNYSVMTGHDEATELSHEQKYNPYLPR